MKYRFHLVGLPCRTDQLEFPECAYSGKTQRMFKMLRSLGHDVIWYGGREGEGQIQCTEPRQGPIDWDVNGPDFSSMNQRVISEIWDRMRPRDFILIIAGTAQKPIADAFPAHMSVEWGIGYAGTFSSYKVFESSAWMHTVYGEQQTAYGANGSFWDTVIPNSYDISDFPFQAIKDDYFLYIGRLIERKGIMIAEQVCEKLGARLLIAGSGDYTPKYGELLGTVDTHRRGELMSHARAVFVPTLYVGPFEGVNVEAQLTGTPVLTTDFGAFRETVEDGISGFRCNLLGEWLDSSKKVSQLDPYQIRKRAVSLWDMNVVKHQYERYFDRLYTLWDQGWDTVTS